MSTSSESPQLSLHSLNLTPPSSTVELPPLRFPAAKKSHTVYQSIKAIPLDLPPLAPSKSTPRRFSIDIETPTVFSPISSPKEALSSEESRSDLESQISPRALQQLLSYLDDHGYRLGKFINCGRFGAVYELINIVTGEKKALKIQSLVKIDLRTVSSAISFDPNRGDILATQLDDPSLMKPEEILYWEDNQLTANPRAGSPRIAMIMPLIEGESLAEMLRKNGPLPLAKILPISLSIAKALQAAQRKNIAHRDVKADNILFKQGVPILVDFGIAKRYSEFFPKPETPIGTTPFISPERSLRKTLTGPENSEVWSLGMLIYQMAFGDLPITDLKWLPSRLAIPDDCHPILEDILSKMLVREPSKRCSMDQIVAMLTHYKSQLDDSLSPTIICSERKESDLLAPRTPSESIESLDLT